MPIQFRTSIDNEEAAITCFTATGWKLLDKSYSTDQKTVKIRMSAPKIIFKLREEVCMIKGQTTNKPSSS